MRQLLLIVSLLIAPSLYAQDAELPFPGFPKLETKSTGEWWKIKNRGLNVPRDQVIAFALYTHCLLYTSPSPRDLSTSRMPSSA